jgi:hypothetical protein
MARTRAPAHVHETHWLTRTIQGSVVVIGLWLAGGSVTGLLWAGSINSAVASQRETIAGLQVKIEALQARNDRIAVLESRLDGIGKQLDQIQLALSRQPARATIR